MYVIFFLPLASPLSLHPLTNFKLYHWTLLKERKSKGNFYITTHTTGLIMIRAIHSCQFQSNRHEARN